MAGMPAIFFGHGNPMNALLDNSYTEAWRIIGKQTSRPKCIVSISTHGLCQEPVSPSVPHREPFTISVIFPGNFTTSGIPGPAIRS